MGKSSFLFKKSIKYAYVKTYVPHSLANIVKYKPFILFSQSCATVMKDKYNNINIDRIITCHGPGDETKSSRLRERHMNQT